MHRVELSTELFYAIIPTLFPCFFADLLSLHLVTILMFFNLVKYIALSIALICPHKGLQELTTACEKQYPLTVHYVNTSPHKVSWIGY